MGIRERLCPFCCPLHLKDGEMCVNEWLLAGVGALLQTIKQMQQRMLELKKTLQKELVSAPLLPAACALPGSPPLLPDNASLPPIDCKGSLGCHMLAGRTVALPALT